MMMDSVKQLIFNKGISRTLLKKVSNTQMRETYAMFIGRSHHLKNLQVIKNCYELPVYAKMQNPNSNSGSIEMAPAKNLSALQLLQLIDQIFTQIHTFSDFSY